MHIALSQLNFYLFKKQHQYFQSHLQDQFKNAVALVTLFLLAV